MEYTPSQYLIKDIPLINMPTNQYDRDLILKYIDYIEKRVYDNWINTVYIDIGKDLVLKYNIIDINNIEKMITSKYISCEQVQYSPGSYDECVFILHVNINNDIISDYNNKFRLRMSKNILTPENTIFNN